jgi:hypothetical protein
MSQYPNAIDDNSTLYAPLINRATGKVTTNVSLTSSSVTVLFPFKLHTSSLSEILPLFLLFDNDEIWLVKDIARCSYTYSAPNHLYTFGISYAERPFGGVLRSHQINENVYISLLSPQWNAYVEAIEAVASYALRVVSSLPSSPEVGMACLNTSDGEVYVCFTAGQWTKISIKSHNELSDRNSGDPHPQYMNSARYTSWHDNQSNFPGYHISGGTYHDHKNMPIKRIRSGSTSGRGSPVCVGDFYFDTEAVRLYYSPDGSSWRELAGIPTGAIAVFISDCPPGWERYTAADNRFIRAGNYGTGGNTSGHTHTITANVQHYHTFSRSVNTNTAGGHSHTASYSSGSGHNYYPGSPGLGWYDQRPRYTTSDGNHTHTVTIPSQTSSSTGSSSVTTNSTYLEPPHAQVILCRKV